MGQGDKQVVNRARTESAPFTRERRMLNLIRLTEEVEMQTFNYLIERFLLGRQLWQAQAIVNQLRIMKLDGFSEEACVDRLLPVWEVITDSLMHHSMQTQSTEPILKLPIGSQRKIPHLRFLHEV